MRENLVHENGHGVGSAMARTFFWSDLRKSQPQDPGAKPAPGAPAPGCGTLVGKRKTHPCKNQTRKDGAPSEKYRVKISEAR
jgi:hypothetical protein